MAEMEDEAISSSSFEAFAQAFRTARDLGVHEQLDPESGTALVFADVCSERVHPSLGLSLIHI